MNWSHALLAVIVLVAIWKLSAVVMASEKTRVIGGEIWPISARSLAVLGSSQQNLDLLQTGYTDGYVGIQERNTTSHAHDVAHVVPQSGE